MKLKIKTTIFKIYLLLSILSILLFHKELIASEQNNKKSTNKLSVVTTILPLYFLVKDLTADKSKNTANVYTLIKNSSVHSYHIKPSDIKQIKNSDLFIFISPQFETFLHKIILQKNVISKSLQLASKTKIKLLRTRDGGAWHGNNNSETDSKEHNKRDNSIHFHYKNNYDYHIWLNPKNTILILEDIVQRLVKIDHKNKKHYLSKKKILKSSLQKIDKHLKQNLIKVKHKPYIVFHDSLQYFEKQYGLSPQGSVTFNPDIPLSSKLLAVANHQIQKKNIKCIFTDYNYPQRFINSLDVNKDVKITEIDVNGYSFNLSPENIIGSNEFMIVKFYEQLGKQVKKCLS